MRHFCFLTKQQSQRVCIESPSLNFCRTSFCAASLLAEFRKSSLDFLCVRLRERLDTELDE